MLLKEFNHEFKGGTCTSYLCSTGGVLAIHTITRLGGSYIKTEPQIVKEEDAEMMLKSLAKAIPFH